jgi:hypothetical protein
VEQKHLGKKPSYKKKRRNAAERKKIHPNVLTDYTCRNI